MYFQVIATHDPQDFFCGQEPNELTLTFIVKEDALMENTMPEMQDLPLREGKNTFDYFEVNDESKID